MRFNSSGEYLNEGGIFNFHSTSDFLTKIYNENILISLFFTYIISRFSISIIHYNLV